MSGARPPVSGARPSAGAEPPGGEAAPARDKAELVARVLARLQRELEAALRAAEDATAGATHEDNRAEGDKDMRATEASYQAAGQWQRLRELEGEASLVAALPLRRFGAGAPVALGALVTLEHGPQASSPARNQAMSPRREPGPGRQRVLLLPGGGGQRHALSGEPPLVHVVTPRAPLGAALLGRTVGDVVELTLGGEARELELIAVE